MFAATVECAMIASCLDVQFQVRTAAAFAVATNSLTHLHPCAPSRTRFVACETTTQVHAKRRKTTDQHTQPQRPLYPILHVSSQIRVCQSMRPIMVDLKLYPSFPFAPLQPHLSEHTAYGGDTWRCRLHGSLRCRTGTLFAGRSEVPAIS